MSDSTRGTRGTGGRGRSRGRGEGGRGRGDSVRGRGEGARGRGDGERGRGNGGRGRAERGRGEGGRGRGDGERGRGRGDGDRGRGGHGSGPRGAQDPFVRGGGRGGSRGGGTGGRGTHQGATPAASIAAGTAAEHVTAIGVKRANLGNSGTAVKVLTNHYPISIPTTIIHHYDVMTPSELTTPMPLTMRIMKQLQEVDQPQIFTPRAAYDGRKNLFSKGELPLHDGAQTFDVSLGGPRTFTVKISHVATINPEVLSRYVDGQQSHNNEVLTAITALNVVVRMQPSLQYPFNVRSFFSEQERRDIGNGIVLWRGWFQSVRPAMGRMLINIDISTGMMYKAGPLIGLCLEFLGLPPDPRRLAPRNGFPPRERLRLEKFVAGVRVATIQANGQQARNPRPIKGLSTTGARDFTFPLREGGSTNVAQYFQQANNIPLQHPDVICVLIGRAAIPLEMCHVVPGQIIRKQPSPEKMKQVLEFATRRPADRLRSIQVGLGVLAYGQSEYVRQFGLQVSDQQGPLSIDARVLPPPTLQYGGQGRGSTVVPRDGAWNMIDKQFYKPATIERWCVAIYERPQRFGQREQTEVVQGLLSVCSSVGMSVVEQNPIVQYLEAQGRPEAQMQTLGTAVVTKHGPNKWPQLIVVILPDNATDLYRAVKHFGDVTAGVATQCLKSSKCRGARAQYYANVCLKINVKLGGINTIPEPRTIPVLTDEKVPTIVMGADVMHPPAHSEGRPSFASLVSNVDSATAKYIASITVQNSRQEMIEDLQPMAVHALKEYMTYRKNMEKKSPEPKRLIFYRDGVSEGQFQQVLDIELPRLKAACDELKIKPLITLIIRDVPFSRER